MSDQLDSELKPVLDACKAVRKSDDGEFSYKWLRLAGCAFHSSKLAQLVRLGYLIVQHNGITRRGTAWYRLAEGV
jgi:hypothetical protein